PRPACRSIRRQRGPTQRWCDCGRGSAANRRRRAGRPGRTGGLSMWKLSLSQLKTHPRRYIAVVLAITLATMLLASPLLVTSSAKETTKQMLGATYANADLLINATQEAYTDPESALYDHLGGLEQPGDLEAIPGVAEVYPLIQVATGLVLPEGSEQRGTFDADADFLLATNTPDDTSLLATPVTEGALPTADSEI